MSHRRIDVAAVRRGSTILFLWALLLALAPGPAGAGTADYVIQISVDGLGSAYLPGLVYGNQLPNFKRLEAESAWTLNARNDYDKTVTLPNHTTMITGRQVSGAAGHNWTGDSTPPTDATIHSNKGSYVASAYDVAHDNGLSTAMFANKSKLILFPQSYGAAAGAPDVTGPDNGTNKIDLYLYRQYSTDIVSAFASTMASTPYQYSLLHLRDPDDVGHASGWGTPAYNSALKKIDGYLGTILDLVEASPTLRGRTAIILTADHGGRSTAHSTVTEPLTYTIPFFIWGPGVTPSADLYAASAAARLDPGYGRPKYSDPVQPIRNGDVANLALQLLGLGPVPGSTINVGQDLGWQGAPAARPAMIAYTAFNEPPQDVGTWTPGPDDTELGFATTSTPQGGTTAPVAATYSSATSPLRLRMESVLAETAFDSADLRGYTHMVASIDIMLKNVTYTAGDSFTVTLTNGTDTLTLAEAHTDASGDTLNALAKNTFLHYSADIPDGWSAAALKISGSNDLNTESMDFDNIYLMGMPVALTLQWTGAADNRWNIRKSVNWSSGGETLGYMYKDGDHVVFGDTGSAAGQVDVATVVAPGSVSVNNDATEFVFGGAGSIAGPCGLTKNGRGTLTLATSNTYTGDTRVNAGTLIVGADRALGRSAVLLGDTTGSTDAALLVSGAFEVDRPITVQDDGSPTSSRTLGGANAAGTAVFSGPITIDKDLTLTAAPGGEVRLAAALDNSKGRTITKTGDGAVTLTGQQTHGAGAALVVSGGTVNLDSDAGAGGIFNLTVSAASASAANFGATQHLAGLNLAGGARANLAAGHDKVLVARALGIEEAAGSPTSRLDVADNAMIIDYDDPGASPLQAVTRWIAAGYDDKKWDSSGIVSTSAAADALRLGLGYAQNDLLFTRFSTFAGEDVDATSVLVKYTYLGDVNLDGKVDDNDVTLMVIEYDRGRVSTHTWQQGDISGYDGKIDDNDVTILVLNYGAGWKAGMGGTLGGISAAVPEPAALALLALGAAVLWRRR